MTNEDITRSYVAALVSSVSLSIGMRKMAATRTAQATGATLFLLNMTVATAASAAGGFANNVAIRQCELERGVDIICPDTGESLGKSKIAARQAVT
jgi:hypothetical protein